MFLQQKVSFMKTYIDTLKKCSLFDGIDKDELDSMLNCLSVKYRMFTKEEFIIKNGDKISDVGLVLSGSVHIVKEDFWGNRNLVAKLHTGQLFGESYACANMNFSNINVVSSEQSEILFLHIHKIMTVCSCACKFHSKLIQNLLFIISEKNLMLTQKIEHMSKRTTKEKLLSYLFEQSLINKSVHFQIPFNRQQLADYLSVDRSAMSNELCKLRDDGILNFKKNYFHLNEKEHSSMSE